MLHILNELRIYIDPITSLNKHGIWTDSDAQWKRYCALNSMRFGVKNGHNSVCSRNFFPLRQQQMDYVEFTYTVVVM